MFVTTTVDEELEGQSVRVPHDQVSSVPLSFVDKPDVIEPLHPGLVLLEQFHALTVELVDLVENNPELPLGDRPPPPSGVYVTEPPVLEPVGPKVSPDQRVAELGVEVTPPENLLGTHVFLCSLPREREGGRGWGVLFLGPGPELPVGLGQFPVRFLLHRVLLPGLHLLEGPGQEGVGLRDDESWVFFLHGLTL